MFIPSRQVFGHTILRTLEFLDVPISSVHTVVKECWGAMNLATRSHMTGHWIFNLTIEIFSTLLELKHYPIYRASSFECIIGQTKMHCSFVLSYPRNHKPVLTSFKMSASKTSKYKSGTFFDVLIFSYIFNLYLMHNFKLKSVKTAFSLFLY